MQTALADFETNPPFGQGLLVTMAGADHTGSCHRIRPGGRVVLTGFAATADPASDLLLTVRGNAEPGGPEAPARIAVNGTEIALLHLGPSAEGPAESRVPIPASLLAHDATDKLTFGVEPSSDGAFLLWRLALDPASPLPTPPEFFDESFTTCPVRKLTGGTLDAATVIATARRRIQQSPRSADPVATALRHLLLAHGFTRRPEIARAIVELTPDRAARAAGQLARFLTDVAHDPSTDQAEFRATAPIDYEQVATVIALAVLDDAYTGAAASMFRNARPYTVAVFAADYAQLGPAQREQALAQLAGLATATTDQTTAEHVIKALLRLDELEHVLTALRAFTDRGLAFSHVARPLADADPRVQPALVDSALRALATDPGFMLNLAPRTGGNGIADVASDVLACGEQYRERVARVLRGVVDDAGLSPEIRWSAAFRLALVDDAEQAQATGFLTAQGIYDPEAPPPAPPARTDDELAAALAAVRPVWERIEHELAQRFPGFGVSLGGPASLTEVIACEEALGLQLPVEFVASALVHREIQFGDLVVGMPNQVDIADLANYREWLGGEWTNDRAEAPESPFHTDHGWRDGWVPLEAEQPADGRALDLDPTPAGRYGQVLGMDNGVPQGVDAPGWLAVLERFAAHLEQGRYVLHTDGYLDLRSSGGDR